MQADPDVRIVDYEELPAVDANYAFDRLNREWLEKFFAVEPIDETILSDPRGNIVDSGGAILYALSGAEIVGTVALKNHGNGDIELTKMAVNEGFQGRGLGRRLLGAALVHFDRLRGTRLYLESHSSLAPALALYESAGFRHEPRPAPSDYARSDVYMVYRQNGSEAPA